MLFAHITEITSCDSLDINFLPKYHVLNDAKLSSSLSRMPKVVYPLCDRFSNGESCLGSDVKNWTLTVQLISDKRYVHLDSKTRENDAAVQNDMSVNDSNFGVSKTREHAKLSNYRELVEKTKSFLQELAQTNANALEEAHDRPKQKQSAAVLSAPSSASTNLSSDVSDAENYAARYPPAVDAAHPGYRKRKTKPTAMEETWKLLDSAVFRKTKPEPGKGNTEASFRSVHCDKKQFNPIHIPLELTKKEHYVTDPRLTLHQQRKYAEEEMDLPLPFFKFITDAAQVFTAGERQNMFAAESRGTDMWTQRPIDVIIGAGRVTEAAGAAGDHLQSTRIRLMESLERSIHMLSVLDESEFVEFSHELNKFQYKLTAVLWKHHNTHAE